MLKKRNFFLSIYKNAKKNLGNKGLGKYPGLKEINKFVISQAKTNFAQVQGHKMYLDPKDSLGLSVNEIYGRIETEIIKNEIQPGNNVLDIGANIGYFTLIFANLVSNTGKVFAFEPEPQNFSLLKQNIEINGYKNVVLENRIVSDRNGKTKLYLSEENAGMHRIYPSHFCSEKFVQVEMLSLDDYFQSNEFNNKINFIKIDAEGSELGVLNGMTNLLESNKKVKIFLEFVPSCIKEFGAKPGDLLSLLKNNGYNFSFINEDTQKLEPVDDMEFLLRRYDGNKLEKHPKRTNLLCQRN